MINDIILNISKYCDLTIKIRLKRLNKKLSTIINLYNPKSKKFMNTLTLPQMINLVESYWQKNVKKMKTIY